MIANPADLKKTSLGQNAIAIDIDLGGTNVRVAAYDQNLMQLAASSSSTRPARGPENVFMDIASAVMSIREEIKQFGTVIGLGIGAPGPLELPSGRFLNPPNLPRFRGFEIKAALESATGLPTTVEKDANLAALAEWKVGLGKITGCSSSAFFTLGTGVGSGLILDGRIWHGTTGIAGDCGHISVRQDGMVCSCGTTGCLECYASATAVCRMAKSKTFRDFLPQSIRWSGQQMTWLLWPSAALPMLARSLNASVRLSVKESLLW